MNLIFKLLLIFGLSFGANYLQPNLQSNSFGNLNIPDTHRLVGIMVQFPLEYPDNPKTSGDGNFLNLESEEYNHFYDSPTPRCEGFIVDRPPHDSLYFQKQLEAVGNYYHNISNGKLPYTANIITNSTQNGYFTVSKEMEYYAKGDALLAEFFSETLELAKSDIEAYLEPTISPDQVVFVVFHAGLSQDFAYPSLDPTIYDLKSAYIDKEMMQGVTPAVISDDSIFTGILVRGNALNCIVLEDLKPVFSPSKKGELVLRARSAGIHLRVAFVILIALSGSSTEI